MFKSLCLFFVVAVLAAEAQALRVLRAELVPVFARAQVVAEIETEHPSQILVTLEAISEQRTRVAAAKRFDVPAGRHTVQYDLTIDARTLQQPVVRIHEATGSGWNPPLETGAVFPYVTGRVASFSGWDRPFTLDATFAAPRDTSCVPNWRGPASIKVGPEAAASQTWHNGELHSVGQQRAYRIAPNASSIATFDFLEWNCSIAGRKLPPIVAPFEGPLSIDLSKLEPVIDSATRITALQPVIEAANGQIVELPFSVASSAGIAAYPGEPQGLPPGARRLGDDLPKAAKGPSPENAAFRIYIPSTAAPGVYTVTAAHPTQGQPPAKWILRVAPASTDAAAVAAAMSAATPTKAQPLRVVLLLDKSASARNAASLEAIKKGAIEFAAKLGAVELSLIAFDTGVQTYPLSIWSRERLMDTLLPLEAAGESNLPGALLAAERQLKRDPSKVTVVAMITDGAPNRISTLGLPCPAAAPVGKNATAHAKTRFSISPYFGAVNFEETGKPLEWGRCAIGQSIGGPLDGEWAPPMNQSIQVAQRIRRRLGARLAVLFVGAPQGAKEFGRLANSKGAPGFNVREPAGMLVTAESAAEISPKFEELRVQIMAWAARGK